MSCEITNWQESKVQVNEELLSIDKLAQAVA